MKNEYKKPVVKMIDYAYLPSISTDLTVQWLLLELL